MGTVFAAAPQCDVWSCIGSSIYLSFVNSVTLYTTSVTGPLPLLLFVARKCKSDGRKGAWMVDGAAVYL